MWTCVVTNGCHVKTRSIRPGFAWQPEGQHSAGLQTWKPSLSYLFTRSAHNAVALTSNVPTGHASRPITSTLTKSTLHVRRWRVARRATVLGDRESVFNGLLFLHIVIWVIIIRLTVSCIGQYSFLLRQPPQNNNPDFPQVSLAYSVLNENMNTQVSPFVKSGSKLLDPTNGFFTLGRL
jgi:hypothetical protein